MMPLVTYCRTEDITMSQVKHFLSDAVHDMQSGSQSWRLISLGALTATCATMLQLVVLS